MTEDAQRHLGQQGRLTGSRKYGPRAAEAKTEPSLLRVYKSGLIIFAESDFGSGFQYLQLLAFHLCMIFLLSASEDLREIKVKPGQDVPLLCQGLRDASVKLLEWVRPDLRSEGYVFFYRNERPYENYQHESFHGRVELRDPEMKDGDASVILRNVTFNDTGTYECRIITNPRQEIRHQIELNVTDSDHTAGNKEGGDKEKGNKDGFLSIIVGLSVAVVVLVLVVVVVSVCVRRKRKHLSEHGSYKPPEKSGDPET